MLTIPPNRCACSPASRATQLRTAVACLAALLGLAASPAPAAAQAGDPVDDLILRVVADVSDLRYEDALRRGRELLRSGGALRSEQEVSLRVALAAAFYSDVSDDPQPDSAFVQFERVLRLAPDAEIPIALAWGGLDSLLQVARERVLAVVIRPPADSLLVGGPSAAELPVVATRAVRYRLSSTRVGGTARVVHQGLDEPADAARLTLRAHDGGQLMLAPGYHDVTVTAVDPQRGDSVDVVRRIRVVGSAPALLPEPVLDSTRLRPVEVEPRPVRAALTGLLFATVTMVFANEARAREPIRSSVAADERAGLVGGAILAGTAGAIWLGRDGRDAEAEQYNAALRATHARSVRAAASENARRLAAYRAVIHFRGLGL